MKASGAFAAGTGPVAQIAFGAALVFLLVVGVLLWTAAEPARRTPRSTAYEITIDAIATPAADATQSAVERRNWR